jgi:hypothetical protein
MKPPTNGRRSPTGEDDGEPIPGRPYRGSGNELADKWWKLQGNRRGITRGQVRERLHQMKDGAGLGPTDDVVIGRTGDVYDASNGQRIGTLTQPIN